MDDELYEKIFVIGSGGLYGKLRLLKENCGYLVPMDREDIDREGGLFLGWEEGI